MDTLIQEVELLAKEKEAEHNGEAIPSVPSHEWESLEPQSDHPPTRGREIPVLPVR